MAQPVEISCIKKKPRNDPHDRIKNVGGKNADGTAWCLAEEIAIEGIESGKWAFYVRQGGRTAKVIVATRLGKKYLKTENDGVSPDNLLSLPEC